MLYHNPAGTKKKGYKIFSYSLSMRSTYTVYVKYLVYHSFLSLICLFIIQMRSNTLLFLINLYREFQVLEIKWDYNNNYRQ